MQNVLITQSTTVQAQELWLELHTKTGFDHALSTLPPGKLLVVDYYASWCAVCKSAYPGLCRMAADEKLTQHFVFAKANLEETDIKNRIKAEGIVGIPWMCVYGPGNRKVAGFGASFKKLEQVRKNLEAIIPHKDHPHPFRVDPNGFLMTPSSHPDLVSTPKS